MDYSKIYIELMERSFERKLEGYSEKHHINPRCRGGSNDKSNIAILTPEEHFLAHQLLIRIFPEDEKLIYAANMMCVFQNNHRRSNKLYGWLRKKLSNARTGTKASEETKRKMATSHKGKKHSEEARKKMRDSNKDKPRSDKQKLHLINMSEFNKGSPRSNEVRIKISLALEGDKNHMYGKKHTEETLNKMSEVKVGDKNPNFGKFGKNHHSAKPISQYTKNLEFVKMWYSIIDASVELKICSGSISKCCKGKSKSAGGFIWKYNSL